MDEINVQPEGVASEGAISKSGETSDKGETSKQGEVSKGTEPQKEAEKSQLLTPEQVNEIIRKALIEERPKIYQSVADKLRHESDTAIRRAQVAEGTLTNFRGRLGELDPEMSKDLELAEYKARAKAEQVAAAEEAKAREQGTFIQTFNKQTEEHLAELGIDLDDKRLDLALDASPLERRERIDKSIRKIIKANAKTAEEKQSQVIKDVEAKIRKDLGLDSVDTSNPVGVKSDASSKAELNRKYAQGEISMREYEEGSNKYK